MILLAFECSAAERSVAVARHGEVLASASRSAARATPLLGMADDVLQKSRVRCEDVDCLVVGLGPGSYTGIRGAIAAVQGWSEVRPVKLLGVSSADAVAHRARMLGLRGQVAVVIDAQRGEFYAATYHLDERQCVPATSLRVASPTEVSTLAQDHRLVGPDLGASPLSITPVTPDAATVIALAMGRTDFAAPESLEPIYLRATAFVKAVPPRPAN